MFISEISIKRPVLATVMCLTLVLFGAISFFRLPIREAPDIDPPIVSITTVYRGANSRVVEVEITQILEDELSGIEGVKSVVSVSREQVSLITIEFELARSIDAAAQDVRDKVLRVRNDLPDDIDEPVIAKQDADASPFIWVALYGEGYSMLELTDSADRLFKDRLQNISGVGGVIIGGEKRKSIRIWLDPYRLASHRLTITDIANAVSEKSVNLPSGRIEGTYREFSVFLEGELSTPHAFEGLVIRTNENVPIRIGDVARVEYGPEDDRKLIRFNGKTCVGVGIIRQSKANALEVARLVRKEVEEILPTLSPGVEAVVGYDSTVFISRAIREVRNSLFLAGILVILVIFVFLRTLKATFIPAVTIPASLIATFTAMYFLDFTINILTILGLTLAIGLVVDDSIVVLETIYRSIEEGEDRKIAAFKGMKRVSFAVLSTTVVLIAVFIPLAFITGNTGRLFREFGITLAIAVSFSTFIALTLTPMLCSVFLSKRDDGSSVKGIKGWLGKGFSSIEQGYERLLQRSIKKSTLVILIALVVSLTGVVFFKILPSEFLPVEDRGVILNIIQAPEGSTLEYTLKYQTRVEEIMMTQPEVERTVSVVALGLSAPGMVNEGILFSTLIPWEDRTRTQQEIVESIFPRVFSVPGVLAFPINPPSLGRSFLGQPIEYIIQGNDYDNLFTVTQSVLAQAKNIPGVINLNSDLKLNKPELLVEIDRNRANDLGVSVRNVATTLQVLLGGKDFASFEEAGEQYDVMVQLEKEQRSLPNQLESLYIRGDQDRLVQLSNVIRVRERTAPRELNHYNRRRAVTITGSLLSGFTLGEALDRLEEIAKQVLPAASGGYETAVSGQSREYKESGYSLIFAFNLALIVIYLALAAQFESFTDPLTILVTVPLAITGAFGALYLMGMTLNLYSQIGLVMLVGLATKNGILIVEFANQLKNEGLGVVESVIQAGTLRFRPVLMTAISTIFGMIPIAFATGAGSESRSPMGMVVIGGMLLSTLLTLVVIPVVHILLQKTLSFLKPRLKSI
jgi:multidrug efflux pump